jgi:hypothetical protein
MGSSGRSVGAEQPDEEEHGYHSQATDDRCRRPASTRDAGGSEHGGRGEESERRSQREPAGEGTKRPAFDDDVRRESVAQLSRLVEEEQADGEERHAPEGERTAMHRDDELRRQEGDCRREQQRSDDQSLDRGEARRQRQPALQGREAALDEQGQAGQQRPGRGGDRAGGAAEARAR